jgi:hypothetical protein
MKSFVPQVLLVVLFLFLQLTVAQNPAENPAGATGAAKNSSDAAKTPGSAPTESNGNSTAPAADVLNRESNPGDPLLDVPPLPKGKVTLVGGRVGKIDPIADRIVVEPFGGGAIKVFFDERTHIYRDGTETTQANIHKGDRVYVDTMLDGPHVFARNIRVVTRLLPADASGQVLSYDRRSGAITVNDMVSAQPVSFSVGPQTIVRKQDNTAGSADDLREGTLVAVRFSPGTGHRGAAQQVSILAVPGTTFTFAGKVTHLDMRAGLIAVDNQSDHKTYDIAFDPAKNKFNDDITVGSQVQIVATFTGKGYQAEQISPTP